MRKVFASILITIWGRDGMLSGIHIGIPSDIIDEPWYPEMVESIRNQN